MVYDCIILGGGPAGLSAAVYLGRYLRPTLVLNEKKPQTRWHRPIAHNILGFPAGIHRNQLLDWGKEHAGRYKDVELRHATVGTIRQVKEGGHDLFEVCDEENGTYRGKGLILAMGVDYDLPKIEGLWDFAGYSIWHCPECDGYKTMGKKIAVIGADRGSVEMALTSTVWTREVVLLTNGEPLELDEECSTKLGAVKIEVVRERIVKVVGDLEKRQVTGFELEGGRTIEATGAFVNLPCKPPEELLHQLPLELERGRWVTVDHRMRTNIPKCYAAGDIVANAQTQLSVAMGTGATAAIWLHKELLPEGICLSGRKW